MKQKLLLLSLSILLFGIGFSQKTGINKNMNNIVWEQETQVIRCSEFNVTKPLTEIVAEHPITENSTYPFSEYPDKKGRPVQTFNYTVENDGSKYGNDPSVIQNSQGKSFSKDPIQNWAGQTATGFRPFDPSGAVSSDYYIQMINSTTYKIFDKTGTALLTGTLGDLWSPSTPNSGDPIVLFDKAADRWFMSQFGEAGNKMYIAISQSNNPLGSWYTYTFSSPDFPDYLKFSAWQDGYYMTANYAQKIFAFNRTKMLSGDASAEAVYKSFSPPQSGFFVPLPADASDGIMPGAGTPCPIFSYSDDGWGGGNVDAVNIYNASVNWSGTPVMTVTSAGPLPTVAFDASYDSGWYDIPQPGTTMKLDGIGGCLMYRAQWKKWVGYNTVVLSWGVKVSSFQRGIFWCELRQDQSTNNWSIYQQGIYAPGTDYFWMSSAAMDNGGNIALCYAKASSSTYMSLAYAGRLASDQLGTLPITEVVAYAGAGSQTSSNRNGDYSQTCLDPDGYTFWHTGEYIKSGGSAGTRIYSFKFTTPEDPQNLIAQGVSTSQINLSWNLNLNSEPVLMVWSATGTFGPPVDGTTYNPGDVIPGGGIVLSYGTSPLTYNHTGLNSATTYYYKAWSYLTDNTYSNGISTAASTLTGDPISLSATTISKYQIDLSWALNGETNDVIVAWSTDGIFGSPVNGNAYAEGYPIPDGGLVLYAGNNTSYNHISLNPGTQYFYKAWSVMPGTVYSPGITTDATTNPDTIFYDDFENPTSWTINGEWEIDAPQGLGGDYGNPDPSSAFSGTKELGLDLTGLGTYPGDYEANLGTHAQTAVSPSINCSNYSNISVSFQQYLGVESPSYDHAYFEISTNGETSWTQVWTNTATISDVAWSEQAFDVSSYADGQADVKFRFSMGSSDGDWQYCGWNVDDLLVFGTQNVLTSVSTFTVKDANSANPIEAAQINVNGRLITTNSSGVGVSNLPDGTYSYIITAYGYYNGIGSVTISGTDIAENVQLTPKPTYPTIFTVTDSNTSAPIAGANVNINGTDIVTDGSGVVSIDLFDGTFQYIVSSSGYNSQNGTAIVNGATQNVDIALVMKVYSVTIKVTETNGTTPIQNAVVDLGGTIINTDAAGNAVFTNMIPNSYNWSISKPAYYTETGNVTITNQNTTVNVSLTLLGVLVEKLKSNGIKLFPNPSDGTFNIYFEKEFEKAHVKIIDISGKIISESSILNKGLNTINIENAARGIYFVHLIIDDNYLVKKIVLE